MNNPCAWSVDHIGIAVTDLNEAVKLYQATTHAAVLLREKIPEQGVELVFLDTPGSKLELLAPIDPNCALARFISKRGPGLHHICYRVNNIQLELDRLANQGCKLIDKTPRTGAGGSKIAFIAPGSFSGVLTELCQLP